MPAAARMPLEDQDPVVLELLRLAAEVILAHPGAVPLALYDLCDTWADALADALSRPARTLLRDPTGPVQGGQAATACPALPGGTGARSATEGAPVMTAQGRAAAQPR